MKKTIAFFLLLSLVLINPYPSQAESSLSLLEVDGEFVASIPSPELQWSTNVSPAEIFAGMGYEVYNDVEQSPLTSYIAYGGAIYSATVGST